MNSSGFVVLDAHFRPVYANPESINILIYPNSNAASNPDLLNGILVQKILSFLPRDLGAYQNSCALQFRSGRRSYRCRAFILGDHWNGEVRETRIALLLERGMAGRPLGVRRNRVFAGMYEDPFSFIANPRFYHFSRAHQEVFASLRNVVTEKRGIGVLFAQSGMGKTALINYLSENLRNETDIAYLPGSFEDQGELIRSVMAILGVEGIRKDPDENIELFEKWLLSKYQDGRNVVLMCDDAQELDQKTFDNLRLFSGLEMGQQKLLQVVLAGRQQLLPKLSEMGAESIGERANVYCRLNPFDEAEVISYVQHRLRIAGCNRQVFSSAALSSIALYSRGIPLNINMLCRQCLSLAVSNNLPVIDERMVADSAYDLVLRAQPVDACGDSFEAPVQQSTARRRDRRGLRLVEKP